MQTGKLIKSQSLLLIIDIQEKLIPVIHQHEIIKRNINVLIQGAEILDIPMVFTEQYPKGLGHTCSDIHVNENAVILEKDTFSCMLTPSIAEALQSYKQIVICGTEAHICVLKTALDLLEQGKEVHIIADGVSSRTPDNKHYALERMRQAGAYIETSEMVLFQWLDVAGTTEFKAISKLIK